jgi:hypothetical protein
MELDRDTFSEVFMIPLTTAVSSGFTFSENWSGFELKQHDQVVATLRRPSMWSPDFLVETINENWVIRRSGFWGNRADIFDAASQRSIARFKSAWGGKGTLTFAEGPTFLVVTRGCWHPVWTVTTDTGQAVLQLHTRDRSVELYDIAALPESRLSLLVLFTLYRVRQAEEAAVAASAVAS